MQDLQHLLNMINIAGDQLGLIININKTKFMAITRESTPNLELKIGDRNIQQVSSFKYLGAMLNEKCDDDEEVKIRVNIARNAFARLRTYLTRGEVPLALRMRVARCYIWPIILYGAESWSLKVKSMNRLEACEM